MEMQTKDNRNYTNQLPKWAIGCHIGLISLFLLLGMGMFVLTAKEFSEIGLSLSILFIAIGVAFLGLSWLGYKNLREYVEVIIKIRLGENGYDYYAKDKKKGIEHKIFLPYENMNYVLIGMEYRYKMRYKSTADYTSAKLILVRSAKILICGVSTNNRLEVTSFTHWDQESLYKWIDVFQTHGVDIFHTDKALTAIPNNPKVIESIPKNRFEGTLSFVIGSEADGLDNIFLTEEQQEWVEEKEKVSRKNGLYFTILVSVLQIIMICFWFPYWEIVDKSFNESSGETIAFLLTVLLQFLNMRTVKWYEPIRDMIIIYIGILIGIQLSPDERTAFQHAVQGYAIMSIGSLLFLCYGTKLFSWFKKILVKAE